MSWQGKTSKQRKRQVSLEQYENNHDRIFKKDITRNQRERTELKKKLQKLT